MLVGGVGEREKEKESEVDSLLGTDPEAWWIPRP